VSDDLSDFIHCSLLWITLLISYLWWLLNKLMEVCDTEIIE
jgi:hypothetical protein